MKLKCIPEDFQVEELPEVSAGRSGRFALYRLTKRGIGTLEAVEAIRRRWNLAGPQVRYGGLKDRHALTVQYLTIHDGPARGLRESAFDLEPVGRLPHPYGPQHFRGNRFVVVLRDLDADEEGRLGRAAAQVATDGLPNYFDDQRFGSVGYDGEFIAHAWLRGDYERALWLALAAPNPLDRTGTRSVKDILRRTWNDWPAAKAELPRSHERSLVTYLVDHPADHRGAFARLNRDLRSLYFSAFQSHLWNLLLAGTIEGRTTPAERAVVAFKVAALPIHRGLSPDRAARLRAVRLPLPSARTPPPEGPVGATAAAVVAGMGLTWEGLRIRHLKDVFFSKGDRAAVFDPRDLSSRLDADDLYGGRRKLTLAFELPKGAYATVLVKRLTDGA